MSYIGVEPAAGYASTSKQTITGTGVATYNLDYDVANESDIRVYVNNVHQEGGVGKAYTVSGNQITFSENISSDDDCYVIYAAKSIQTTSHPEGQDLKARDGTFTGDVSAVDGTFSGDVTAVDGAFSGDVGIGTTSPNAPLEVAASGGGTIISLNRSNTNTTGRVGALNFTASDGHSVAAVQATGDGDNEGADLVFYTTSAATSSEPQTNDRMRIDSDGDITVQGDSLTLHDSLTYAQPIARNYNIIAPTINDGGYQRAWTRLGTFSSSGRGIFQFRMNYQSDHNYSRFFSCVGEIHQWESSTGVFNMSVYGTGGNVTGQFKTTSSRELWFRETGSWSHKMCLEIMFSQHFTVDMATYQKNQSPPTGTVRSISGTGSISVEASWGS